MDDFPLSQESNDVVNVRIIGQAKDIVISLPGLLFCGEVFGEISDHVACGLNGGCGPGEPGGGSRIYASSVIDKITGKERVCLNLFVSEVSSQLMHDGSNDLQMPQFLGTCRGGAMEERVQNPCAARLCGIEQRRNGECAKTGVAV